MMVTVSEAILGQDPLAQYPATKAGIQVLQALPVKIMDQVGRVHLSKGQADMVSLVDKVQVEVKDLVGKAAVATEDIDDDQTDT